MGTPMQYPAELTPAAWLAQMWPVPYLIGIGGGLRHAVPYSLAEETAAALADQAGLIDAAPVCLPGYQVNVVPKWGEFTRGNRRMIRVCPTCAWTVALWTDTVQAELDALQPTAVERAALRRLVGDELIAVHLAEAILREITPHMDEWDERPNYELVQLLAAVSDHAPQLLADQLECWDGGCDHRPDEAGDDWSCTYPGSVAACPTCSLRAGFWAGECEGHYLGDYIITAPCPVFTALSHRHLVSFEPVDIGGK